MLEDIYRELENDYHLEKNILKMFQKIPYIGNCYNLRAEIIAFQFMENNQNGSDKLAYFGSFAQSTGKDGSLVEIPSIENINHVIIQCWIERISQTENPVLKARYSGLVWEFSYAVTFNKPSRDIAVIYIKSLIEIVENRLQHGIDLIQKIQRAISVSISINNKQLRDKSKAVMLFLEDEIGENDKPGLWGFCFDSLLLNKKTQLSKKEQDRVLQKLEQRLIEVNSENGINTWASECIISRLAPYYRKLNKIDDARRVLRIHGNSVKDSKKYSMLLQYQRAIKDLQKLYAEYGLREESDELLKKIREGGAKVLSEMQLSTSKVEISKEKLDKIITFITSGTKEEVFYKLIDFFTPSKDLVTKSLNELATKNVLSNLFRKSIVDETGREVANIGTLEEDLIGNMLFHVSQDFHYNSFYINRIFDRLINELNYCSEDVLNFIEDSSIISESRINIIRKGVQAYFDNDFIVCEHLLIPQIESSIRNFIEQNNGVVLEPSSHDSFQLKTFNKLLLDDIVKHKLGEDIQIYFRALFTDPRGWNLRNKICHGLIEPNSSTRNTSERVLHSLLIIGAI